MKCFVINLEKDIERKNHMNKILSQTTLEYEFVTGTNGKNLTSVELELFYDAQKASVDSVGGCLTLSEIGCALSHLKIYQYILDQELPYALILEDDVCWNNDFQEVIDEIESILSNKSLSNTVILLGGDNFWYTKWRRININEKYNLARTHHDVWYAYSYVITKDVAKVLIKKLIPLFTVIDNWDYFVKNNMCNVLAVIPNVVIPSSDSLISNIESERVNKKRHYKRLRDIFYHKIIYNLLYKPFIRRVERLVLRLYQNDRADFIITELDNKIK